MHPDCTDCRCSSSDVRKAGGCPMRDYPASPPQLDTEERSKWRDAGVSFARGGSLQHVPWIVAAGVLLVLLVVAIGARACS